MNIRPHHLLCIQNFTGHGYSEEFTAHMTRLKETLADDTDIILTEGCDDVCVACPYNHDGACASLEKVKSLDENVLARLNLNYRDRLTWKAFSEKALNLLLNSDEFSAVCSECEWYELCTKINSKRAK